MDVVIHNGRQGCWLIFLQLIVHYSRTIETESYEISRLYREVAAGANGRFLVLRSHVHQYSFQRWWRPLTMSLSVFERGSLLVAYFTQYSRTLWREMQNCMSTLALQEESCTRRVVAVYKTIIACSNQLLLIILFYYNSVRLQWVWIAKTTRLNSTEDMKIVGWWATKMPLTCCNKIIQVLVVTLNGLLHTWGSLWGGGAWSRLLPSGNAAYQCIYKLLFQSTAISLIDFFHIPWEHHLTRQARPCTWGLPRCYHLNLNQ